MYNVVKIIHEKQIVYLLYAFPPYITWLGNHPSHEDTHLH